MDDRAQARILVSCADPQRCLQGALVQAGYEVAAAGTADDESWDLVLTDADSLPDPGQGLRVLTLLDGSTPPPEQADDFLSRPVRTGELLTRVARLLAAPPRAWSGLEYLPFAAGWLSAEGTVLACNAPWQAFQELRRGPGARPRPGQSYLLSLELGADQGCPQSSEALRLWERATGPRPEGGFLHYACICPGGETRYFQLWLGPVRAALLALHWERSDWHGQRRRWAHDLNNTLSALNCLLEVIEPADEPSREALAQAREAGLLCREQVRGQPL